MFYFENFCQTMGAIGVAVGMLHDDEGSWEVTLHQTSLDFRNESGKDIVFETPEVSFQGGTPKEACKMAFQEWFNQLIFSACK